MPPRLSRRQFLATAAAGGGLLLAACGSAATPGPSNASAAAGSAIGATWDELVANARKEGKVVVNGTPDPQTRDKLPAAFKAKFGIDMEFLGGNSSQLAARV